MSGIPLSVPPPRREPLLPGARSRGAAPSTACRTVAIILGMAGFIMASALFGLWAWRYTTNQNDIRSLSQRLDAAEGTIALHTQQIDLLHTTLNATQERVADNEQAIVDGRAKDVVQDGRLTSIEQRTNSLEQRVTAAELKVLGVMQNVTVLQASVSQAQQDIVRLYQEVALLQVNASDHEQRITQLESLASDNARRITDLHTWLQGNLTRVDQRLDQLNTTFTVTASGTAVVASDDAIPAPVEWQTRSVASTGGFDVEYLWISDTRWVPTLIKRMANESYSFEVTNFTATGSQLPFVLPPSPGLDRPLLPAQSAKFALTSNDPQSNATVTAARWNNERRSLQFQSTYAVFDAVTIIQPLTFIIGFL